ncbi:MAG: hypothetical protein NTV22_15665 [bacterium]|nr:hypothetical protein [bacterium]
MSLLLFVFRHGLNKPDVQVDARVQTTMIYTHVAKKNIPGVKSPLDA